MYKKSVRRRRLLLALLVVVSLVLLTTHFREPVGGFLHAVQRGTMEAIAPIQKGADKALKPARDLGNWVGDLFTAKSENSDLKKQVVELQAEAANSASLERENSELRKLARLEQKLSLNERFRPITATVITRSPTVWYATVTINSGSSSGVRANQAVVNGDGLIGMVTSTSAHAAQVTLITDHTSAVSAQVVPGGAVGVVKPEIGDPGKLVLDFVNRGKRIRAGQIVATAGWRSNKLESRFPRGLPIGRISDVESSKSKLFKEIRLRPFADLKRIYYVQVLRKR